MSCFWKGFIKMGMVADGCCGVVLSVPLVVSEVEEGGWRYRL